MTNLGASAALELICQGMEKQVNLVGVQGISDVIEKGRVLREIIKILATQFHIEETKILKIIYFIFKLVEDYGPIVESTVTDIVRKVIDFKDSLGL